MLTASGIVHCSEGELVSCSVCVLARNIHSAKSGNQNPDILDFCFKYMQIDRRTESMCYIFFHLYFPDQEKQEECKLHLYSPATVLRED